MNKVLLVPRGTKVEEAYVVEPVWQERLTKADISEQAALVMGHRSLMEIIDALATEHPIIAIKLLRRYQPDLGLLGAKQIVDSRKTPKKPDTEHDLAVLVDIYKSDSYHIHSKGLSQAAADEIWAALDMTGKRAMQVKVIKEM